MNNKRFNNSLGTSDYDVFKQVVNHYDIVQDTIASEVIKNITNDTKILLEIGCGSGITTLALVSKNKSKIKILAVDNEPKMLEQAKTRLQDFGGQVELINSEITAYLKTLKDASIDGIYSGWVIHNIDLIQRAELFKEIGRVLKPGSFFVNGDEVAVDDIEQHKKNYDGFMVPLNKLTDLGRDDLRISWIKHYEEDELIKFTEQEQKELLARNNLTEPEIKFRTMLDAVFVAHKR